MSRSSNHIPLVFRLAVIVLILAVLPFLRTLNHGLVNLDDYQYTVGEAHLTDAPLPVALAWVATTRDEGIWMPVTRLSYLIDCRLFRQSPRAMHAVNVAMHGLNAVLLFLLLAKLVIGRRGTGNWKLEKGAADCADCADEGRGTGNCVPTARLTGDGSPHLSPQTHGVGRGVPAERHCPLPTAHCPLPLLLAAALAALFWALHPLRVEAVAWIASRKDLLSLLFELAALIAWTDRFDHAAGSLRRRAGGVAALVLFALAGMAKPSAMTFPILAGLLEWLCRRGRIDLRDYAVPVVMACLIGIVAQQNQVAGGAAEALSRVPFHGRLLNAAAAFGLYCWKTLWPSGLAVQCIHRWPDLPRFWAEGLAICAGYGALLLWSARRSVRVLAGGRPRKTAPPLFLVLFTGLAWFLVAVGPMLGIANFGIHAFADRFTYLPSIGFSIVLVFLLAPALSRRAGLTAGLTAVLAGAVLLALGLQAARQAGYWRDEQTLFEHTLAVDGETNHLMRGMLGLHLYEFEGDLAGARRHMDYAFARSRSRELGAFHHVYVEVLAESGDLDRSREETRRCLDLRAAIAREQGVDPSLSDSMSYLLYAIICLAEGDLETARGHVATIGRLFPGLAHADYLLGRITQAEGDSAVAIRHWRRSLEAPGTYLKHRFIAREIARLEAENAAR